MIYPSYKKNLNTRALIGRDLDLYNPTVIAFDPGETTGWTIMSVGRDALMDPKGIQNASNLLYCDYGQIDCVSTTVDNWGRAAQQTANWNSHGENNGIRKMIGLVKSFPNAAVVCEDFIPDMKKMDQARHTLSPVRLMAGFSYALEEFNYQIEKFFQTPFFIQNRSLAKTTMTDDRLKNLGLYDSNGGMKHARDATRHAFYFLRDMSITQSGSAFRRYTAWPHLFNDPANDGKNFSKHVEITTKRPKRLGEII